MLPFTKLTENRLTRTFKRRIVRSIISNRDTRTLANHWYGRLGDDAKGEFYRRYAKLFRDWGGEAQPGEWIITFDGYPIRLPLREGSFWLDWDHAVSILGHDLDIKKIYASMIASDERPDLFIDIGANYGIHSTLFLSAGIPVLAFEPNQRCLEVFKAICALNGFSARWEAVAMGNEVGTVELTFPEKETWLGSISNTVAESLRHQSDVLVQKTSMARLDNYIGELPEGKILIKIDVEGFELEVLHGASEVLRTRRPMLIFESIDHSLRPELYLFFEQFGYALYASVWRPWSNVEPLSLERFVDSRGCNFVAIAREDKKSASLLHARA